MTPTPITRAALVAALLAGTLTPEQTYVLDYAQVLNTGASIATTEYIHVKALKSNELYPQAYYSRLVPNYAATGTQLYYSAAYHNVLGVWNQSLTPAAGDIVFWDGLVWNNLYGTNGTDNPMDEYINGGSCWELEAYDEERGWKAITLEVTFDPEDTSRNVYGELLSARCYKTNNVVYTSAALMAAIGGNVNPIDLFQWGSTKVTNNTVNNGALVCVNQQFVAGAYCGGNVIDGAFLFANDNLGNIEYSRVRGAANLTVAMNSGKSFSYVEAQIDRDFIAKPDVDHLYSIYIPSNLREA